MKNDYLIMLRQKHKNPQKAYLEYLLKKNLWRAYIVGNNVSENINKSIRTQEKINKYCENLLNNLLEDTECSINVFFKFPVETFKDNFWLDALSDYFKFLGLSKEETLLLFNDQYKKNLKVEVTKINNWEDLNQVMISNNSINRPLERDLFEHYGETILNNCNANTIICAYGSLSYTLLDKIENSFKQLSYIMNCDIHQVGMKINIHLDTDYNTNNSGYIEKCFTYHKTEQEEKMYLNSNFIENMFAHEWAHLIDIKLGKSKFASEENRRFLYLLEKTHEYNEEIVFKIQKNINKQILNNCIEIINKYNKLEKIKNIQSLKYLIKETHNDVIDNKWNKKDFIQSFEMLMSNQETMNLNSILCTELDTLYDIKHIGIKNSIFSQYAKNLDSNLGWKVQYSQSNVEKFARIFESYVKLKLKNLNVTNVIAKQDDSSIMYEEETIECIQYIEPVINEIKAFLQRNYSVTNNILLNQELKKKSKLKSK